MRIILIAIYIILYFILTLPFLLIGYIIGLFSKKAQYKYTLYFGKIWSSHLLSMAGTKITVTGLENIPKGPALFIGNHRSWFDIPVLFKHLPNSTGFIAKKEMKKVPIMSWWMTSAGCLFLDRHDVRAAMKTMIAGVELLKNGHSMVIFPEGTRSKTDDMLPFKQGSLKLAEKAGIPVVPFGISRSDYILEKNGKRVKPANVQLNFGKPVFLNELEPSEQKQSAKYVQHIVSELIEK
ncbi:1-acyl-sn-glycerol-3-phosphate acyltransferase [Natranaerovirga pectinivora]|uniref:1-acyl-sn-glycerol-3-phosphate acyltransferase n=1 Tax=Natranaerovirga pectinivora TaxID=682400 RepID=A0A4R3MN25_9FIRM|nr:lysophospholipid acyltransferase family protein [Natranaerovirga pectinivora]TCT13992.1 1-acyl-sn-glycerol-3-phosphate acyltransferase [Natranaerovirga pectinivora]